MYVPVLEEQNGQYEFVFHDVCWLLLQERFQGNPVPLDRLIEVLNSVPLIEVGPWVNDNHDIWIDRVYMLEHGYHGLAFLTTRAIILGRVGWWESGGSSAMKDIAVDPYNTGGIQEIFNRASISPPASSISIRSRRRRQYDQFPRQDCSIQGDQFFAKHQRQ